MFHAVSPLDTARVRRHAEPSWPAPPSREAFHGIAGEVVHAILPHTEADPAALLTNFLVGIGSLIGPRPHALAEAARHGLNLFKVDVAPSSKGRKGSAWSHLRELFQRIDPVWAEEHLTGGLSSGEGLIWTVRDPVGHEVPVKHPQTKRPTGAYELLVEDAGVRDKRMLFVQSEFASILKVMTREGNTLSTTLRQAWDAEKLTIATKNSPATATGAHVSLVGHITREELLRHLNETETANGFGNRFLWTCARRSKLLPHGGGLPDYNPLVLRLKGIVDRAREIGLLQRGADADAVWEAVYPLLSRDRTGLLGAVTSRAEAQVLRYSVAYAVLDGSSLIRVPHLLAALALWEFHEACCRFIFGDAMGDAVADTLLAALRPLSPRGLDRTGLHELMGRNVRTARLNQALELLITSGYVRRQERRADGLGRPAEVFTVVTSDRHSGGTGSLLEVARAATANGTRSLGGDERNGYNEETPRRYERNEFNAESPRRYERNESNTETIRENGRREETGASPDDELLDRLNWIVAHDEAPG